MAVPLFRLQAPGIDVDLPLGPTLIGRSSECDVVIDDELASRRHAIIHTSPDGVSIEDLASRNGVRVDGVPMRGTVRVPPGGTVTIGNTVFTLVAEGGVPRRRTSAHAVTRPKLEENVTVLGLRAELIDKAFAMGRVEDAEAILSNFIAQTLAHLKSGQIDHELVAEVTRYALRTAAETGKASWLDPIFQLHHAAAKVIPAPTVDELYALARPLRLTLTPAAEGYLDWMREQGERLNATERFASNRLEGLARILRA